MLVQQISNKLIKIDVAGGRSRILRNRGSIHRENIGMRLLGPFLDPHLSKANALFGKDPGPRGDPYK